MPHPTPSSTCPPSSTTTSQPSSSPSAPVPEPDDQRVEPRQSQEAPPREKNKKHDSLTADKDSASRSAGVTNTHPGPSPAALAAPAASLRQPPSHLRLTSLGRVAPRESLDSPTTPTSPSSRLSQESDLSSLDYHQPRRVVDDKRISLNTFLTATPPPWLAAEQQEKEKAKGKDDHNKPKMHQTSSRLLRQTEDDRPFTRVSPIHHLHPRVCTH